MLLTVKLPQSGYQGSNLVGTRSYMLTQLNVSCHPGPRQGTGVVDMTRRLPSPETRLDGKSSKVTFTVTWLGSLQVTQQPTAWVMSKVLQCRSFSGNLWHDSSWHKSFPFFSGNMIVVRYHTCKVMSHVITNKQAHEACLAKSPLFTLGFGSPQKQSNLSLSREGRRECACVCLVCAPPPFPLSSLICMTCVCNVRVKCLRHILCQDVICEYCVNTSTPTTREYLQHTPTHTIHKTWIGRH